MINYEWKINALNVTNTEKFQDVIIEVHYDIIGTDSETNVTERVYGSFNLNNPTDDFIDFQNVTKEIVIGWLEETYSEEIEEIKNNISKKISKPPIITHIVDW